MFTLVDLSRAPRVSPYVSREFFDRTRAALDAGGRVLVYFNRRWAHRAYVCTDCSFSLGCPRCDLPLALHNSPENRLVCHHCGHFEPIPSTCPKCRWARLKGAGIGIQTFESELKKAFPEVTVARLDSDSKETAADAENADILLATSLFHKTDPGSFDLAVFPCLDAETVANEYGIEEEVYAHVRYVAKDCKDTVVQTFAPESRLARALTDGNYKEFLTETLAERKRFGYPPYKEIAYVTVSERTQERAQESIARLLNKLSIVKNEHPEMDAEAFGSAKLVSKRMDAWHGRIVVKGKEAFRLLDSLRVEITRNRSIRLEWR